MDTNVGFINMFSLIFSGIWNDGFFSISGIDEIWEINISDVTGNLSAQDLEIISTSALNALRLMDEGQLYKVLGLENSSCKTCECRNIKKRMDTLGTSSEVSNYLETNPSSKSALNVILKKLN